MLLNICVSLFILTISSNADYLYYKNNHCVENIRIHESEDSGLCWDDLNDGNSHCLKSARLSHFYDGWHIVDGACTTYPNHVALGMKYNDYQFLQGFTGLLFGFFLVFLSGFVFILQGRR